MLKSAGIRWALVGTLIAVVVLVPFMIWDEEITTWTEGALETSQDAWVVGGVVVVGLMASDIVAPIPNSLLATGSGMFLGFVRGTLASTIGMVISCFIGYFVGLKAGRPTIGKFVGDEELARLERLTARFGYWAVALTRALPVLGEAAVVFAGMSRMPLRRFTIVSVLSCLGLSAVYGAAGHYSGKEGSFIYAFLASVAISALGMWIVSLVEKRSRRRRRLRRRNRRHRKASTGAGALAPASQLGGSIWQIPDRVRSLSTSSVPSCRRCYSSRRSGSCQKRRSPRTSSWIRCASSNSC